MRWLFCSQAPQQNVNFGYGPANDVKRRLLTLWNSVRFFLDYARIESFEPGEGGATAQPLDRWLAARGGEFLRECEGHYERYWTPGVVDAFEGYVDDVSNWYIRRSRRRFWNGDGAALHALWDALVLGVRVVSPVMPFLAEELWRALREEDAAESVFLAGWPSRGEPDSQLLAEMAAARRVVDLGRQARSQAGVKHRQPLRRLVVDGASLAPAHVDEVKDELRVKDLELGPVQATELRVKPNLPVLGPRLGKELAAVRAALEAGEFEQIDGGFSAAGHALSADDVLVEQRGKEGWAVASADGVTVALDTSVDAELELEGRVLDAIHQLNSMRKDAGLELTDRIVVTLPAEQSDLMRYEDWIKEETLAVRVEIDGRASEPRIAKA
jgi:isoleucyl-tRNA synthetase